jgi:Protein of unknown function (DUF3224)
MTTATGTFELQQWNEHTWEELERGSKLTTASVEQAFTGDLEGKGSVEWVMAYRADGTAEFAGFQQIAGTLGGKTGTIVVSSVGTFSDGVARGTWKVVEGAGAGELTSVSGDGEFEAPAGPEASFTLRYDLS